jgi:hypothetical protein
MKFARAVQQVLFAASVFLVTAPAAYAQPVNGCPAGQAMQSSDPSGKKVTCVAIPDAGALQAQINAEAQARTSADQDLRASINEATVVGAYAFAGPLTCLLSNNGFNDDLTPKAAVPGGQNTVVQQFLGMSSGIRTFHAGGTGTTEITQQVLNYPVIFYTAFNGVGIGFGGAAPNPGGGASVAVQQGTFTWHIGGDGKLHIIEDATGAIGTFTKGGSRVGWTIQSLNLPNSVAVLGKDLKTLITVHEDLQVETSVQTSPDGVAQPVSFRICTRERVMTKL